MWVDRNRQGSRRDYRNDAKNYSRNFPPVNPMEQFSAEKLVMTDKIKQLESRTEILNAALNRMVAEINSLQTPAGTRLNIPGVFDILNKELASRNIEIPFEASVVSGLNDTISRSLGFNPHYDGVVYTAGLFSERFFQTGDAIAMYFPHRKDHIYSSIHWLLTASLVFTLIIIATFITSIFVILRQKKISEVKSDFINNMTHEFKTPIATISLAADSIVNPRILNDPERIQYYTRVIKEENKRMNNQVESVLQMSLLEKQDFSISLQSTDVHDLINQAVYNIGLQVEKRGGELTSELNAENSHVLVDDVHFLNVVFNLLDNANKYSPETPKIIISTESNDDVLKIRVKDHGMGMDKETRTRIFEKFYRKQTGNIHNVKGFGLGLSYVKAIVQACGGKIHVDSEPGKGSSFEIELPLNHDHNNE
jgi:signal transduction histidine kinase